jgi:adenylate cyclase
MDKALLNRPSDLTKADIFSFGTSLYNIILGGDLPENGEEWHKIRRGEINGLEGKVPENIKVLIKKMMSPDLAQRPSACEILRYMERAIQLRSDPILDRTVTKNTRDLSA